MKLKKHKKLVQGVGVNDANYPVAPDVDGKQVVCPFYRRWKDMLKRCYSHKYTGLNPSYNECTVSPEWHSFMRFKSWMEKQDWEGGQLDKDILFDGNKVYSEEFCVFVTDKTHTFITDCNASRGGFPIGVCASGPRSYRAQIKGNGKTLYLGSYATPEEAHQAWRVAKYEQAVQLASEQSDPRVAAALINRYKI